jgi:hypothetical protein
MKLIVTLALIAFSTHAASSLKQNLKVVQPKPESQLRDVMAQQISSKINGFTQVDSSTKGK